MNYFNLLMSLGYAIIAAVRLEKLIDYFLELVYIGTSSQSPYLLNLIFFDSYIWSVLTHLQIKYLNFTIFLQWQIILHNY